MEDGQSYESDNLWLDTNQFLNNINLLEEQNQKNNETEIIYQDASSLYSINEPKPKKEQQEKKNYLQCCVASLGAFYLGYNISIYNIIQQSDNLMDLMGKKNINSQQNIQLTSYLSSSCAVGAIFGCIISIFIVRKKFKRRKVLMLIDAFAIFVSIFNILGIIPKFQIYYKSLLVRFFTGIICGLNTIIVPIYIREIAHYQFVQLIGLSFLLLQYLGVATSFCTQFFIMNTSQVKNKLNEYEYYIGILTVFPLISSIIRLVLIKFRYKSESVYLKHLRNQQYRRGTDLLNQYCNQDILQLHDNFQKELVSYSTEFNKSLCRIWKTQRKQISVSLYLAFFQQFSGINIVLFYTQYIITLSDDDKFKSFLNYPDLYTLIVGISLISIFLTNWCIYERYRKKQKNYQIKFISIGSLMQAFIFGISALFILLFFENVYGLSEYIDMINFICIMLFVFAYTIFYGPPTYTYMILIANQKILPFTLLVYWSCQAIQQLLYPFVVNIGQQNENLAFKNDQNSFQLLCIVFVCIFQAFSNLVCFFFIRKCIKKNIEGKLSYEINSIFADAQKI